MCTKWNRLDQSLYECVATALKGIKNDDFLTLLQYEKILYLLQQYIEKNDKKLCKRKRGKQ